MSFSLEYLEQVPYEVLDDPVDSQAASEEIKARIGKYLVMESLRLPFTVGTKIKIARDEVVNNSGFTNAVRKSWTQMYGNKRGIELAELETEADFLDVFEDIWPIQLEEEIDLAA
jgi:hypothetical protein